MLARCSRETSYAQVTGISINNCQNVTISNSEFDHNFWFGVSISNGLGGTASPTYQYGFNAHGNVYNQNPVDYEKFAEAVRRLGLFIMLLLVPPLDGH